MAATLSWLFWNISHTFVGQPSVLTPRDFRSTGTQCAFQGQVKTLKDLGLLRVFLKYYCTWYEASARIFRVSIFHMDKHCVSEYIKKHHHHYIKFEVREQETCLMHAFSICSILWEVITDITLCSNRMRKKKAHLSNSIFLLFESIRGSERITETQPEVTSVIEAICNKIHVASTNEDTDKAFLCSTLLIFENFEDILAIWLE